MVERLLIVGASGHAHAVLALLRRLGTHRVMGLIDDTRPAGGLVHGLPVLGGVADLPQLCAAYGFDQVVIAIGDNGRRQQITDQLRRRLPQLRWPVLVDPTAVVAEPARLGQMEPFSSLAPGVHCGGRVQIGERAAVGLGASVVQHVRVGADTVVGAGAVVLDSLPPQVVAHGVPARVVRSRSPLEAYL